MKSFLTFGFVPHSHDVGLLVLRAWLGLMMLLIHGWPKLIDFNAAIEKLGFPWILGACAVLTESIAAASLVIGFGTRWAALFSTIAMIVAVVSVHHANLGIPAGERPLIYLAGFLALLVAGGGRYSVDAVLMKA